MTTHKRYHLDPTTRCVTGPGIGNNILKLPAEEVGNYLALHLLGALESAYNAGHRFGEAQYAPKIPGRQGRPSTPAELTERNNAICERVLALMRAHAEAGHEIATQASIRDALRVGLRPLSAVLAVMERAGAISRVKHGVKFIGWRLGPSAPPTQREVTQARMHSETVDMRAEAVLRYLVQLPGGRDSVTQIRKMVGGGSETLKLAIKALAEVRAIERHMVDGEKRGWRITPVGAAALADLPVREERLPPGTEPRKKTAFSHIAETPPASAIAEPALDLLQKVASEIWCALPAGWLEALADDDVDEAMVQFGKTVAEQLEVPVGEVEAHPNGPHAVDVFWRGLEVQVPAGGDA